MNRRLWIVFAILVIAAVGSLVFWKKSETPEATINTNALDGSRLLTTNDVGEGQIPDHFLGKEDSKVTVIMYEDFACIHCNEFNATAEKIFDEYGNRVLFIYRNFSLGYPNSTISISAAEAAYLVGGDEAYWGMHRSLFSEQKWTSSAIAAGERKSLLTGYAEEAGLDKDKFFTAIDNYQDNGIKTKMDRDKSLGKTVGVEGTPVWFINGSKIDSVSESTVRAALKKALGE